MEKFLILSHLTIVLKVSLCVGSWRRPESVSHFSCRSCMTVAPSSGDDGQIKHIWPRDDANLCRYYFSLEVFGIMSLGLGAPSQGASGSGASGGNKRTSRDTTS